MTPGADALVVIPPPSPSDTNPPLGPAVLRRVARQAGLEVDVLDLNIDYITSEDITARDDVETELMGDMGKDRARVASAAQRLFAETTLGHETPAFQPDTADPIAGMHYSFAALDRAVRRVTSSSGGLGDWLWNRMSAHPRWPPRVLGVSVMGPSQVFPMLVALRMVKAREPAVITVAGGSHVTLLLEEIRRNPYYRRDLDVVLGGHSETEFVDLLAGMSDTHAVHTARQRVAFEYRGDFDGQLDAYDRERVVLPVQFTRGCTYARCTFCTYPVVEPVLTSFDAARAADVALELYRRYDVPRLSVKDSLFTTRMLQDFSDALTARAGPQAVRWSATSKVSRRLVHIAPHLREAGCGTLELGVETIHPRHQAAIDKRIRRDLIEEVVTGLAENGIGVVVNLMFGFPDETLAEAEEQLAWLRSIRIGGAGARIDCSLNMVEAVRGAPMTEQLRTRGMLHGVAPWAFSYRWTAPQWRWEFAPRLLAEETRHEVTP